MDAIKIKKIKQKMKNILREREREVKIFVWENYA